MIRNTVNFDLARKVMEAAGAELLERMGQFCHDRAKEYCPVDTGALWNSIVLVSAGGTPALVSGSKVASFDTGNTGSAVSVVAYEHYAVYVHDGYFAGLTWVPPRPFLTHALADTISSFSEIVNASVFAPFRGQGGWGEIESTNAGSSSPRGPLAGPKF